MQIEIQASENVIQALKALGRTEDVHLSPSNRRLAVAGFKQNAILILDVELAPGLVKIPSALTVTSADFSYPHGAFWLDEERLIVANRGGQLAIVQFPTAVLIERLFLPC